MEEDTSWHNSTVLSERLFYLECEGVVTKKIYQEVPPKVE
ncbi:MAG: winged helix-turn-helix transcriptional regulator [Nitrososphaeraceae archaeon]